MEAVFRDSPFDISSGHTDDAVDYKGRPVFRSKSGRWRSALFIIGKVALITFARGGANGEIAYYGIAANLLTYFTGPLHQSNAVAATNVNVWAGAASLLPLLGAFVADSFLGRYRTILLSSLLYIMGLGMLTLSATLKFLRPPPCAATHAFCPSPSRFQMVFFFPSLYLVALAQGGHKPCVQAFGADQFDVHDPAESKSKSSFFNWWYFGLCTGTLVAVVTVSYIQDNLSWGLVFGIPCIAMAIGLFVFLFGTRSYRYCSTEDKNPFISLAQVFVAAARQSLQKGGTTPSGEDQTSLHLQGRNCKMM